MIAGDLHNMYETRQESLFRAISVDFLLIFN